MLSPITKAFLILLIFSQAYTNAPAKSIGDDEIIAQDKQTIISEAFIVKHNVTPKNEMLVSLTAYSSTVDQCDYDPFITASNQIVRDGIVANNILPFGTKVMFPEIFGSKIFDVQDRMNKKYRYTVDIWMPTREQAKRFGIKKARMIIL